MPEDPTVSRDSNGDDASPGLPGDLVRAVAERLRQENVDLREYGYQLALVPEEGDAVPLAEAAPQTAPGTRGPNARGDGHGHWSEVEVQKLPNNDLSIRLRGYDRTEGTDEEERMAELIRELLSQAFL